MLELSGGDAASPELPARDLETRIGPSGFPGETRTEPLSFVSGTSNRACGDSPAEIARGSSGPSIDEPLALYASGAISYLNADGLGSVVATNTTAGTVSHGTVFDVWGVAKSETGTRAHSFTYTGREVGEAGLLFYRARQYQPGAGRFTSKDPLGFVAGQESFYSYAAASPAMWRDPLGLVIMYGNHGVVGPFYHSKIVIIPENQERWKNDPRFALNRLPDGRYYATVGAGPLKWNSTEMIAGINRDRDVGLACGHPHVLALPARYSDEDRAIEALFDAVGRYNEKRPPYYQLAPIEGGTGYNSNGFIRGIGQAAGFDMSFDPGGSTPGWQNPVPSTYFQ